MRAACRAGETAASPAARSLQPCPGRSTASTRWRSDSFAPSARNGSAALPEAPCRSTIVPSGGAVPRARLDDVQPPAADFHEAPARRITRLDRAANDPCQTRSEGQLENEAGQEGGKDFHGSGSPS